MGDTTDQTFAIILLGLYSCLLYKLHTLIVYAVNLKWAFLALEAFFAGHMLPFPTLILQNAPLSAERQPAKLPTNNKLLSTHERAVERVCSITLRSSVPIWTNALTGLLRLGDLGLKSRCILIDPLQLREMAIQNPNNV